MFSSNDLKTIEEKGIKPEVIEEQLNIFKTGFPFLKVKSVATIGNGIVKLTKDEENKFIDEWDAFLDNGGNVEKFVPASGAASRMFKNLYEFVSSGKNVPETQFEKDFFSGIKNFAFYPTLDKACQQVTGQSVDELVAGGKYTDVVKMVIFSEGMNYGNLPKAVLEFHKKGNKVNTALEEHLEEGAQYAKNKFNEVKVHFTVSPEHRKEFEKIINAEIPRLKGEYNVNYDVEMSEQKPSTDTIAVNPDNTPFRENGNLFFRPAGHGALLENLNDLNADVVFIKNIDNVVPNSIRDITIRYKKVIGGYLVALQKQIAEYIGQLESGKYSMDDVREMITFLHNKLNVRNSETKHLEDCELVLYILKKLNRPIRVCGVVKNDGEPGGGPYIVYSDDNTTSPQILESSQFDMNDPESKEFIRNGSHFNPVDLVCYIKDKDGNKFDLKKFVDKNTGFISEKSRDGRTLKALELPGLWNGSMSDWNTVFVEVPIETFNPVKTVNDLLRPQHQ